MSVNLDTARIFLYVFINPYEANDVSASLIFYGEYMMNMVTVPS